MSWFSNFAHWWTADRAEAAGTWVAAVGTVGAFIWQARAIRQERETRRAEVSRLDANQRAVEEAQARTIIAFPPFIEHGGEETAGVLRFRIANYGIQPVTNLTSKTTYRPAKLTLVGDSFSKQGFEVAGSSLAALEGGDEVFVKVRLLKVDFGDLDSWALRKQLEDDCFLTELDFTDVHGNRWTLPVGPGQQPSRIYPVDC